MFAAVNDPKVTELNEAIEADVQRLNHRLVLLRLHQRFGYEPELAKYAELFAPQEAATKKLMLAGFRPQGAAEPKVEQMLDVCWNVLVQAASEILVLRSAESWTSYAEMLDSIRDLGGYVPHYAVGILATSCVGIAEQVCSGMMSDVGVYRVAILGLTNQEFLDQFAAAVTARVAVSREAILDETKANDPGAEMAHAI
jgi:hypothetical protein